jgi:Na+-transporting methylmalonyl-CoA/oxaloacetate decarboxylase gamma subunit
MPHFCYPFMKEWGSWICGMSMVLFSLFCLVSAFMLIKKLSPSDSGETEQEDE